MGEIADEIIARILEGDYEEYDYYNSEECDNSAYTRTCKYCRTQHLAWTLTDEDKWALRDMKGALHECNKDVIPPWL